MRFEWRRTETAQRHRQRPSTPPVADWARERLGFEPDEAQAELLGADGHRLALCCCRQWGKSTVTALKALHLAAHRPGSTIVATAPTLRQAAEWLKKARTFALKLGGRLGRESVYTQSVVLENGSRMLALPAAPDHVRGPSAVDLLVVDEAAFVPDELYEALLPTLATTDGGLWLMSTPGRQEGLFYSIWHGEGEEWKRVHVPATRCARISERFLAGQRETLGEERFRREYLCEFTSDDGQILTREQIEALFDDSVEALNGGRALWKR